MDQPDGCQEVPFNSFFGISDVLNLRESCMRENRTCSLRGGRRLACKRASSDPTIRRTNAGAPQVTKTPGCQKFRRVVVRYFLGMPHLASALILLRHL